METKTFKVWCRIVTIVNAFTGSVTKDRDGAFYLKIKTGVTVGLLPATPELSLEEYRRSVFSPKSPFVLGQGKGYIKPKRKSLLELEGTFKYDRRLKDCHIVIADKDGSTVEILRHSIKNGFVNMGPEPVENILNDLYYFPILAS